MCSRQNIKLDSSTKHAWKTIRIRNVTTSRWRPSICPWKLSSLLCPKRKKKWRKANSVEFQSIENNFLWLKDKINTEGSYWQNWREGVPVSANLLQRNKELQIHVGKDEHGSHAKNTYEIVNDKSLQKRLLWIYLR